MPKTEKTAEERFLEKVEMSGEGHWLWTGALNDGGYAKYWFEKRVVLGHRWAYEHWKGPIPPFHVLDHICKVHKCVNPEHVEPVPLEVNTARGEGVTAQNMRKDACKWGHPLNASNTYTPPGSTNRMCKTCLRQNNRLHYQRHLDKFKAKNDGYRRRNPNYDRNRYRAQKTGL